MYQGLESGRSSDASRKRPSPLDMGAQPVRSAKRSGNHELGASLSGDWESEVV